MDVKCERCNAEYDFDESLLGDKGTTVKCSTCGHVFRVLPRRGAARPALKLRYVRTGHIEALHSIRDLQTRIRNGEVSVEDQLGREGFPWRRLGDIPELKNFFARGASNSRSPDATPQHPQLRVSQTSMPPPNNQPPAGRPHAGRTVLGMGPAQPHIPPAPRVPTIAQPGVATGEPRQPVGSVPEGGRFGSEAPTAARQRPVDMASLSQAPTVPGVPSADMRAPQLGAAPLSLNPNPQAAPSAAPSPQPSQPVRGLYLAEDELPPARATADSSKVWVYAVALLLLGGGGWLTVSALSKKTSTPPEPATATARVETPPPSAAVQPTPAEATAQAEPAAPAPAPDTSPPAGAQQTEPAKAEPQAPATAKTTEKAASTASASSRDTRSSSSASTSSDPKDYGGWVAKGDKAFSKGDLAGARKAFEAALALRATGSEANAGMGFTLLGEGKVREAIPYFDRAASSGYAEASIGLGDAYRRLGQKAAAIEAYQDYLDRLPSGSRATYAKRQIDALKASSSAGSAEPAEAPSPGPSDYRPAGEVVAPAGEN